MAFYWNQTEVVKSLLENRCIFDEVRIFLISLNLFWDGLCFFQLNEADLSRLLTMALILNQPEFVTYFLNRSAKLGNYLGLKDLWTLYNTVGSAFLI